MVRSRTEDGGWRQGVGSVEDPTREEEGRVLISDVRISITHWTPVGQQGASIRRFAGNGTKPGCPIRPLAGSHASHASHAFGLFDIVTCLLAHQAHFTGRVVASDQLVHGKIRLFLSRRRRAHPQ